MQSISIRSALGATSAPVRNAPTVSEALQASRQSSGFDILRIGLALSIILWHTVQVCYGPQAENWFWTGPLRPLVYLLVPSFFALSGFLVTGSLERNDITKFVFYRLVRIYPALILEITLSALIFGAIFTNIPLAEYFRSGELFNYLLNITGVRSLMSFTLPGVFEANPSHIVNGQLWSIPIEFECYLILVLMNAFGVLKKVHVVALALYVVAFAYMGVMIATHRHLPTPVRPQDGLVIASFICGVIVYLLRDKIKISPSLFLMSFLAMWSLFLYASTELLAVFPLTYCTIWVGVQNLRFSWVRHIGNYSYGVFLYGFSIQQAVYSTFPLCRTPLPNFIVSAIIALMISAVSWHLVELRAIENRNKMYHAIKGWLNGVELRAAGLILGRE